MAKRQRRLWRFPDEFRLTAVQRVREGETIVAVARDLDVHRRLIYRWLAKAKQGATAEGAETSPRRASVRRQQNRQAPQGPIVESSDDKVRRENQRLHEALAEFKRVLAEKTLEVDFFKGALQKIEARRQPRSRAGETASTPTSGK